MPAKPKLFVVVTRITNLNDSQSIEADDGECKVLISSVLQILNRDQLAVKGISDKSKGDYQEESRQAEAAVAPKSEPAARESAPPVTIPRPILPEFHIPKGGINGVEEFIRALKQDQKKGSSTRVVDLFE
jgi:hypothetical protein